MQRHGQMCVFYCDEHGWGHGFIPFNQGSRRMKWNSDEGNDVNPGRESHICVCQREGPKNIKRQSLMDKKKIKFNVRAELKVNLILVNHISGKKDGKIFWFHSYNYNHIHIFLN